MTQQGNRRIATRSVKQSANYLLFREFRANDEEQGM